MDASNTEEVGVRQLAARLEEERRFVLDLSGRSALLNHRLSAARGVALEGIGLGDLFTALVEREEVVGFRSTTTGVSGIGTPYDDAELGRRLRNTYYAALRYTQERGFNALFVALGMLEWSNDDSDGGPMWRAPLVLVPVSLERSNQRTPFGLRYTGEDFAVNISLFERLRVDHGLILPDLEEDASILEYIGAIENAIGTAMPGWKVTQKVVLDLFLSARYQLYRDLEPDNWTGAARSISPAALRLIGDQGYAAEFAPPYAADADLDEAIMAEEIIQVTEADSSQMIAVRRVLDGKDLIIQGPPGTGKSQTITNIISAGVAAGKRILFVSEKQAALDVVYNNLRRHGVESIALPLHSSRASRKDVLRDLQDTVTSASVGQGERSSALHAARRFKDRLNGYHLAMTAPVADTGVAATEIVSIYSDALRRLDGLEVPDVAVGEFQSISCSELESIVDIAAGIEAMLTGDIGLPIDHPFWGTTHEQVTAEDEKRIRSKCEQALERLDEVNEIASTLQDATVNAVGDRLADLWILAGHATAVRANPIVSQWTFDPDEWTLDSSRRRTIVRVGKEVRETFERLGDRLLPDAWSKQLQRAHAIVERLQSSPIRWLKREYRRSIAELRSLFRGAPPREVRTMLQYSRLIIDYQQLTDSIRDAPESLGSVFGESWKGVHSDFALLLDSMPAAESIVQDVASGRISEQAIAFLNDPQQVARAASVADRLVPALEMAETTIQELYDSLRLPPLEYDDVKSLNRPDLRERVRYWKDNVHRLHDFVTYLKMRASLKQRGLHGIAAAADTWSYAPMGLAGFVRFSWASDSYSAALSQFPELQEFNRDLHSKTVRQFASADSAVIRGNRHIVAREHLAAIPRYPAGQVRILLREFEKTRNHRSIRRLIVEAGRAIQRIKPVFMMSPLSVAAHLAPGAVEFDLVIFDEASQIRPVDAYGAILRSRQAVIVGDRQQLPPSQFFEIENHSDSEDDDSPAQFESILGLAASRGCPSTMLTWHYRSRFESMIAVSNSEFYDGRLKAFPVPLVGTDGGGLQHHLVRDSVYEPGEGRRFNAGEARRITGELLSHIRDNPLLSVGIAAFSSSQRDRILQELDRLRDEYPEVERFDAFHSTEPIFVKNLENVQGDERDVIFVSIGYGFQADGTLLRNFGPVNRPGGERRLNVIFTRARERCVVFSNFKSSDLDTKTSDSRGLAILQRFLEFAEAPVEKRPWSESPPAGVVEALRSRLELRGFRVDPMVGRTGQTVHLAVVHRDDPSRYSLGVLCDDASHHAVKWARARDRLGDLVLSLKGWRLYRVWSPDWMRNPDSVLDEIEQAIREAESDSAGPRDTSSTGSSKAYQPAVDGQWPSATGEPYRVWSHEGVLAKLAVQDVPVDKLADLVAQVVAVEAPVHMEEVVRRLRDASLDIRAGAGVKRAIEVASERARATRSVVIDRGFLWSGSVKLAVAVRNRAGLPDASREIRYVHENEIASAFQHVVSGAGGIERHEAMREVRRILGFVRSTEEIDERLSFVLDTLVNDELISQNGVLLNV